MRCPTLTSFRRRSDTAGVGGCVFDRTIGDAIREAAGLWPDSTALVDGGSSEETGRRWTFAGLLDQSERAVRLLSARFAPGEHVAVWDANGLEWIFIEFGAALAGLMLVTVKPA